MFCPNQKLGFPGFCDVKSLIITKSLVGRWKEDDDVDDGALEMDKA